MPNCPRTAPVNSQYKTSEYWSFMCHSLYINVYLNEKNWFLVKGSAESEALNRFSNFRAFWCGFQSWSPQRKEIAKAPMGAPQRKAKVCSQQSQRIKQQYNKGYKYIALISLDVLHVANWVLSSFFSLLHKREKSNWIELIPYPQFPNVYKRGEREGTKARNVVWVWRKVSLLFRERRPWADFEPNYWKECAENKSARFILILSQLLSILILN